LGERTIYLVRHGQSERTAGAEDSFGPGLTTLGREQAALIAERLSRLPISAIHHSTLRRARETAEIIGSRFPEVKPRASSVLCECMPYVPPYLEWWYAEGAPGGEPSEEARADPALGVWLSLWPPGTKWDAIIREIAQAEKAFKTYFRRTRGPDQGGARHEVIVCHGNIIRYFVCRALQASPAAWINTDINNCGLCEIQVKTDGRVMLLSHNDTGHLPLDMKTFV
jgi:serine/threonine-protein phosphatase PGAM5